jgi:hypothetical protein
MTQYSSVEVAGLYPISGVGLGGRTTHHARGEFTPTVALTTADVVDMLDLPPRARIIGAQLKYEGQTDSNGSPTWAVNVGITGTAALIFAGSTAGRAAGASIDRAPAAGATDYVTTGKTRVKLVPSANAATFVTGQKIVLLISYLVEEPA